MALPVTIRKSSWVFCPSRLLTSVVELRFHLCSVFGYHHVPMTIRMALFNMDGTIRDAPIDWLAVSRELGLPVDGR